MTSPSGVVSPRDKVPSSPTVTRVPDRREISEDHAAAIVTARDGLAAKQDELERAVAAALKAGASIRAVVEASGLSANTVQKYGRAHGWPTAANRAGFNAVRWDKARAAQERTDQ